MLTPRPGQFLRCADRQRKQVRIVLRAGVPARLSSDLSHDGLDREGILPCCEPMTRHTYRVAASTREDGCDVGVEQRLARVPHLRGEHRRPPGASEANVVPLPLNHTRSREFPQRLMHGQEPDTAQGRRVFRKVEGFILRQRQCVRKRARPVAQALELSSEPRTQTGPKGSGLEPFWKQPPSGFIAGKPAIDEFLRQFHGSPGIAIGLLVDARTHDFQPWCIPKH